MKNLGSGSFVAILLAVTLAFPCMAQSPGGLSEAPINPDFVDYITGVVQAQDVDGDEFVPGLIPEPIKALLAGEPSASAADVVGLPASYDLRTLGKLTPVRNQGGCGSCWAFATYGSLESYLLPGQSWDLSENNLKNEHGFDISCCSGGNRSMSVAYLARWAGPIAEVDDPYNTSSCYSPMGLSPVQHVQNILYIPDRTGSLDNNALKQAVMTYGAVYTTYYHSSSYYKSSTYAYYYSGAYSANHAVCIVGWDDSFPASNFQTAPGGNGAFLCRNSWGPYFGSGGYFWVSYYDTRLGIDENAAFTADPTTNYDTVYQYDDLGWISSVGYSGTAAWFANVFTAASDTSIKAASWYCPSPNCTYQHYLYKNPTPGPISPTPAASKSGTLAEAGYRTVELASPVGVSAGQTFSIVVRLTTPGYYFPIATERPFSGYSSAATASAGQSYISSNGSSWSDLTTYYPNSNVCLKAFAAAPAPTPGVLSVTPSDGLSSTGPRGGPFSPAGQAYTLTNTGGTSIDWTADKTQTWVSLSSSAGSLSAGQSATVTVSINANSLLPGDYSDTVSFTNTTNGQGNTTRSVALSVTSTGPGVLSVTPETSLISSGTRGGPFSPSSQVYTLSNTGGTSINWTAAKTQTWVSLSATAGSLAPGQSATVTASINSNANALASGSYSDTITFTNTTNGSGNTTRAVGLTVNAGPSDYRVVKTTFSWIDPTGHTKLNLKTNSATYAVSIPFGFEFYGTSYNKIYVGSNGMVGFASSGMTSYSNTNIPRTYTPNAVMYGYWDSLNESVGGTVQMGTVGTSPNRKVVVTWLNVPHKSQFAAKFSFQAVMCEGSNEIIFQYLQVSPSSIYGGGRSATIGIENQKGTIACKWSYNTAKAVTNGDALLFTRGVGGPFRSFRP